MNIVSVERDGDFGDRVDVEEDVSDDGHLRDAQFMDIAAVETSFYVWRGGGIWGGSWLLDSR